MRCARSMAPEARSLPAETRARLGVAWLEIARMEHASIAAFARFALQLLAVGAPPDLILAGQRAMADETNHEFVQEVVERLKVVRLMLAASRFSYRVWRFRKP